MLLFWYMKLAALTMFGGSVTVLFLLAYFYVYTPAYVESADTSLSGYAWSENIGWIAFSCEDTDCEPYYGVTVSESTGNLSGYAWSEHVGWIEFGDSSGCPAGSCAAKLTELDNGDWELTGWARALGYVDTQAGGWDGWVSLHCENSGSCTDADYAVRFNPNGSSKSAVSSAGSFAWGDMNQGWVNFSQVSVVGQCDYEVQYTCDSTIVRATTTNLFCDQSTSAQDCALQNKACQRVTGKCVDQYEGTITATPPLITKGSTSVISWSFPDATECVLEGPTVSSSGGGVDEVTTGALQDTAVFSLICDGVDTDEVLVNVLGGVRES